MGGGVDTGPRRWTTWGRRGDDAVPRRSGSARTGPDRTGRDRTSGEWSGIIAGMRRLLPAPSADTTVREAYDVERVPHDDRPWTSLMMVSSLDGSIAVGGVSGGLSSDRDAEVLLTMRSLVDVVFVGAGTVRDEGYGAPSGDTRVGVVSNSGRIDPSSPLFASGAGFLVTTESAPDAGVETLRVGADEVDLAAALRRLGDVVPGVRTVQVEGGARLNGAFLDGDLLDEVNLTVSPQLVGGDGPRLTSGAPELARRFELAHLLVDEDSFVFTRWLRRRD